LDPAASSVVSTSALSGRPQARANARYHGRSVGGDQQKVGVRGFDGHKRVKVRKRHTLVDVLSIPLANRAGAANVSDPVAGSRLLAGLPPLWPTICTIIADAGHESGRLAAQLR
jgi:hypothetical protein